MIKKLLVVPSSKGLTVWASLAPEYSLLIWNAATHQKIKNVLSNESSPIHDMVLHDGLVVVSSFKNLSIYSTESDKLCHWEAHSKNVDKIISVDEHIWSCSFAEICVWHVKQNAAEININLVKKINVHDTRIITLSNCVVLSDADHFIDIICSSSYDYNLIFWDPHAREPYREYKFEENKEFARCFAALDNSTILVGSSFVSRVSNHNGNLYVIKTDCL